MENKEQQQPIPEELKDEQLEAVAGGQSSDAALMEEINAMIDAVKNGPPTERRATPRASLSYQVYNMCKHEAEIDSIMEAHMIERMGAEPTPRVRTLETKIGVQRPTSPEDELWTKK